MLGIASRIANFAFHKLGCANREAPMAKRVTEVPAAYEAEFIAALSRSLRSRATDSYLAHKPFPL
jgi:hypothetical protein